MRERRVGSVGSAQDLPSARVGVRASSAVWQVTEPAPGSVTSVGEVVQGYCAAVRSALTDDGRPPLDSAGLKLQGRLTAIASSLDRLGERKKLPKELTGLRELLRKCKQGYDLAFTPDGPRGPLGVVQPGVILAAAASGFPVQPVAIAASRARRLRSWDRFLVPLPFAAVHVVYGDPLSVPRRGAPEAAAQELKRRLDAAEAAAEGLARGDR